MTEDTYPDPPIFRQIAETERRVARCEQDFDDAAQEWRVFVGRDTDNGRMAHSRFGEFEVDRLARAKDTAYERLAAARAELSRLVSALDDFRLSDI